MTKLAAAPKRWTARSMVLIGRAARVLVVDDSHEGVDALAAYLELLGLKVNTAYSGAAAVNRAVVWVPDVVLLDISMPEMDGFAVARALRTDKRTSHCLIVALTAHDEHFVKNKASTSHFDAYCQKGLILEPLYTLLNELTEVAEHSGSESASPAMTKLNAETSKGGILKAP